MSVQRGASCALIAVALGALAPAPEASPEPHEVVLRSISQAALRNSEVHQNLLQFTDDFGPRTAGSPGVERARSWLRERLGRYGLRNIHTESNPPVEIGPGVKWDPPGWYWSRAAVHQISPWPATLIAVPVLYSSSTIGVVAGETLFAPLPPPRPTEVDAFIARFRGKLRDRIILLQDEEIDIQGGGQPRHRYSEQELSLLAKVEEGHDAPAQPPTGDASPKALEGQAQEPNPPRSFRDLLDTQSRLFRFLKAEGVLAMVQPARGEGGTLFSSPPISPPGLVEAPPATVDLAAEHFNRIVRLMKRRVPVRLELSVQTTMTGESGTKNLFAEIPGSDKAEEIVLVGAHLDSWHGGAGASDNAANVMVVLEAARILASLEMRPRRTIRFAFWDGEELGRVGSRGYVAAHLVDPVTGQRRDEFDKLSGYLNLDYGSGRIRGVYLQGRVELQARFQSWLAIAGEEPLVASPRTTLGSDQASFEEVGIPGIQFIQDPLNYEIRSHHTNMDFPDYTTADDLKHSARVLAQLLYRIAMADERLPRERGNGKEQNLR